MGIAYSTKIFIAKTANKRDSNKLEALIMGVQLIKKYINIYIHLEKVTIYCSQKARQKAVAKKLWDVLNEESCYYLKGHKTWSLYMGASPVYKAYKSLFVLSR